MSKAQSKIQETNHAAAYPNPEAVGARRQEYYKSKCLRQNQTTSEPLCKSRNQASDTMCTHQGLRKPATCAQQISLKLHTMPSVFFWMTPGIASGQPLLSILACLAQIFRIGSSWTSKSEDIANNLETTFLRQFGRKSSNTMRRGQGCMRSTAAEAGPFLVAVAGQVINTLCH